MHILAPALNGFAAVWEVRVGEQWVQILEYLPSDIWIPNLVHSNSPIHSINHRPYFRLECLWLGTACIVVTVTFVWNSYSCLTMYVQVGLRIKQCIFRRCISAVQRQRASLRSRIALCGALQTAASYNAAMSVFWFIQRLIATRWAWISIC